MTLPSLSMPGATDRAADASRPQVVLIADDYPASLAWASRAFTRAGWTVLTAADGEEALARWAEASADGTPVGVLVTDLDLPGLDGIALTHRLRAEVPALPVIALHAGDEPTAAWRGPLPGQLALFAKPVHAPTLVSIAAALVAAGPTVESALDAGAGPTAHPAGSPARTLVGEDIRSPYEPPCTSR